MSFASNFESFLKKVLDSNWYGKCPNSLYYSDRIISLPLHMYLTEEELKYIVDSVVEINDFLNN